MAVRHTITYGEQVLDLNLKILYDAREVITNESKLEHLRLTRAVTKRIVPKFRTKVKRDTRCADVAAISVRSRRSMNSQEFQVLLNVQYALEIGAKNII